MKNLLKWSLRESRGDKMKCPSCGNQFENNGLTWCNDCEKQFQEFIRIFDRVFLRYKKVW